MLITFATQKGGVGKTTLAIAFANYISLFRNKKVQVFDFDFQKSFYQKWKEDDEIGELDKIYDVNVIENEDEEKDYFISIEELSKYKESEDVYLFDLAGTLDQRYMDILTYSDIIFIPFEYSDVSTKSTLVFNNVLNIIESQSYRVFCRSKYDKGYSYKNQEEMDKQIAPFGKILEAPIYKRNDLQNINTRKLPYRQKEAVEKTFLELIEYINETIQTSI